MDRSKWEYKKLGEVATFLNGYAFKPENWSKHGLKIIRIQNLTDETAPYNCYDGDIDPKYIVRNGDLLISWSATLGAFLWNNDDALLNQHIFKTIFDKSDIDKYYLKYCVISKLEEMAKKSHGVTMRHITKKDFDNTIIPYPSISDQQRIVAELDCLNEMIAVKQEQLKEFDKLAQSIFYDMFGDPVSNEKGWDIIELGSKCEVTSFKRVLIEDVVDAGVPFIRGTELMVLSKATKGEKIDFSLFITPEHYERVKAISGVPKVGDLLIPSINSDGNIWILDTDEPRYYKDGRVLWVHVNHDAFSSEALKYIMHILLKKTYSLMATGATFAELKLFVLRELKVPLPPLTLQQQFADKISAIEAQKELVKQNIAETQHLLDYTMDKYFG